MSDIHRRCLATAAACALSAAAAAAPTARAPEQPAPPSFLTLAQIVEAMEASSTSYAYSQSADAPGAPRRFADALWPEMQGVPEGLRVVVGKDGSRSVVERTCGTEAEALLLQADELFFGGDRAMARDLYRRAAALAPDCSDAVRGEAECQLRAGDVERAVESYRRAVEIDPDDHRLRFFLGSALLELGRRHDAVEQLIEALVLRPRFAFALATLQARSQQLGLRVHAAPLLPPACVLRRDGSVEIVVPAATHPAGPAWAAWASCKGYWMGDQAHRKALTGRTGHGFTTAEELECLAVLLATYQGERAAGAAADPELDRLERIVVDGYASELVAYEMASRIVPWATLLLDPPRRERMREFVNRHVVTAIGR